MMRAVCFQHDINMPACRVSTHQYSSSFLKNLVMCGTVPETLTLFQTKICDFPYPISDLIKNLIPYFSPGARHAWPERVTSCYRTYTVVGVNIKREMVLSPNDEEVANSSKKHIHIAYIRATPPGRGGWKTRCKLWVLQLRQARLTSFQTLHKFSTWTYAYLSNFDQSEIRMGRRTWPC